jgi:RNA polymerase sigma-70 factor (ECF subfamily)
MLPLQRHIHKEDFVNFLEKLKCGDDRAWYQLDFVLKRILYKWLNSKMIPVEDTSAIYNGIISIFYEKIRNTDFHDFKNLKSYVFSIADKKVKEFYRNNARDLRNDSIENDHYCKYFVQQGNTDQTDIIHLTKQIDECYRSLNPKEQQVIFMVYKKGKRLKEVSEILGMQESNIRVIKHRALKKIRKKLNQKKVLSKI